MATLQEVMARQRSWFSQDGRYKMGAWLRFIAAATTAAFW